MSLRAAYSIKIILIGFLVNCLLLCFIQSFNLNKRKLNLLVVPFGILSRFETNHLYKFTFLKQPIINNQSIDGLVVYFRRSNLPKKWESFVAEAAVSGIPVYNANHLGEALSGMVDVHHLMENKFGVLSPSPTYVFVKRVIDFVIVFASIHIILPIGLIVALLLKIDSKGGAIFKEKREGFRGREFEIYKIRSMRIPQDRLPMNLSNDQHRVTRVGRFIRKYRLDDIPKLWNVLKGNMSLIGPRPETREFYLRYEKEISFFN